MGAEAPRRATETAGMKKKKFLVIPREGSAVLNGIQTSRGHRKFNGKTYMHISDPSEAREIDQKYGKTGTQDVYVAEDEQYSRALNGEKWEIQSSLRGDNVKLLHNYTFSGVDTSHFKVWVLKRGKLARVTKAQAEGRGYKIVSTGKKRPEIRNAEGAPAGGR
jgi:hypothetical protein